MRGATINIFGSCVYVLRRIRYTVEQLVGLVPYSYNCLYKCVYCVDFLSVQFTSLDSRELWRLVNFTDESK